MKEKKSISLKMAGILLAVCLLIGGTIGGTLAWLVSETAEVKNTFTVGNITLTLAETFNTDSDDSDTLPDKWVGKIIPGATVAKDPKLTVAEGSEDCYVYALIDNTVIIDGTVVAVPNIDTNNWKVVETEGTKTLYRYKDNVKNVTDDVSLPIFTTVTYNGELITEDKIGGLGSTYIAIRGYAHQSANVSQDDADAAAIDWAKKATTATTP